MPSMTLPTRQRLMVSTAVVVSLSLVPMLSGCSGNPVQGIVSNVTGGQVDVGGTQIPQDFPKDVPLASGEVVSGTGIGNADGKVWNVAIRVAESSAIEGMTSQLTGAGFTTVGTVATAEGGSSTIFTKSPYGVLVIISPSDKGGFVANYTVTYTKPGA